MKLEGELLEKVKQCAKARGYTSVNEFVIQVLEKEVKRTLPPKGDDPLLREAVKKRLQGLGYIE